LRFLGLRQLHPSLALRPNNLRGGVAQVRDDLTSLGLASDAIVCELGGLGAASEAAARQLWDVAAMTQAYRASLRAIEQSQARLPRLSAGEAMRESFSLGGQVIRQLVLDPLLPEPLAPVALRQAVVDAMRSYDRMGRDCWAQLLRRLGVPHRQAPVDTRLVTRGQELITAVSGGMA
jgi:phenylacetic acid degradation operon negative regulatory protein